MIWTVPEVIVYELWATTCPSRSRVSDESTSAPETVTLTSNVGAVTLVVGGLLPPVCDAASSVRADGAGGCAVS